MPDAAVDPDRPSFARWRWGWARGSRGSGLLLLGFMAAALIGNVLLMWQTIAAERSHRERADRTSSVLLALRDITRTATNAETGQRGYLITLDRRYLGPFIMAREQYGPNMARLRERMGPAIDLRQRALLDEIERLSAAKFAEMNETVGDIAGGNLIEARRRILTDEGQDVMERLRRAVAELESIELAQFNHARQEAVASEARIVPTLVVMLVFILLALMLGMFQVVRTANAEARAANAAELTRARDRADLLAHELNHRVKNLFAVVLAIVKMTGRDAPEAKPTIDRIAQRIHALLTAHEVTQGTSAQRSANLAELVELAVKPYRSVENQCRIEGPPVELPDHQVVPLGLVLHELTTNAVKYGAWAAPGGELLVRWTVAERRLRLEWRERCSAAATAPSPATAAPSPAGTQRHRGFGSTLIDGSARQLGGTIERNFHPDGIVVRMEFPLAA
ncbi:MAG: CHASE3 domain-containing protein [Pseudomonadota bacterium]